MKGLIAFGALLAVILLGLGLWTATPQGGGGLGDEGGPGQDRDTQNQNPGAGADADGVAQDDSEGRVEIRDGKPTPSTVEVPPQSVVTFINRDGVARRIEFEDEQLKDVDIRPEGAHTFQAPKQGRFSFTTGGEGAAGEIVVAQE